jgi:hypothetical protein
MGLFFSAFKEVQSGRARIYAQDKSVLRPLRSLGVMMPLQRRDLKYYVVAVAMVAAAVLLTIAIAPVFQGKARCSFLRSPWS